MKKEDGKGSAALLMAQTDGTIVKQNRAAESMLGDVCGKRCWEIVSDRAGGVDVPCTPGCVHRIVDAGAEGAKSHRVIVDGRPHQLTCAAAGEETVSVLVPLEAPRVDTGERPLSTRELEVLELLARGLSTPKIAVALGIKQATVRTHLEHLRAKLGVATQAALVAEGYKRGYL